MDHRRGPVRVLVFSASRRADSLNTRLASLATTAIERLGASADVASMREFDTPSYDGDVETAAGLPAGAQEFRSRLEAADAFVIVSPEYNGSMPGVLKNAIDWVSRARPQPFNQHSGLLMSARRRSAATPVRRHDRRVLGPGRSIHALPVHQTSVGRVPRRTSRSRHRPSRDLSPDSSHDWRIP
jgi:NAD(P)H-dependent FMN reductase